MRGEGKAAAAAKGEEEEEDDDDESGGLYHGSDGACSDGGTPDASVNDAGDYEEVSTIETPDEPDYKVINKESLLAAQIKDLHKVVDVLGVQLQHARALLIYHRWDIESLFGRLADKGEERLFVEAGLPFNARSAGVMQEMQGQVNCRACLETVASASATMMSCGHSFCNDCWTRYFIIKILEGQSRRVTCMEHKCIAICDEHKVRKLVGAFDADAVNRYEQSLLESYIEDNSKVKWCPSVPHCGNAIRVDGEPFAELECVCSQQFCFNCLAEPHSPCSCSMWRLWDQKCKDESETVNWLTAHTKPCPKCQKPVEKNGGCNLVACICGQAFCWLCGTATGREHTWTTISGHSCGRYKDEKEAEAQRAQRDLKRYIHYHSRWKGHMDSLKFEKKQREMVQAKISKLEASESLVKDYTWLTSGLQKLFRARRSLAYSYAFAYYMFGNELFKDDISEEQNVINQNLFEDQQQQLEGTVEKLSKLVESPMDLDADDDEVQKIRLEVINLTSLTDALCQRMYDVIENDLLGSLQLTTHHIAQYKARGYKRASEITSQAGVSKATPEWSTAAGNEATSRRRESQGERDSSVLDMEDDDEDKGGEEGKGSPWQVGCLKRPAGEPASPAFEATKRSSQEKSACPDEWQTGIPFQSTVAAERDICLLYPGGSLQLHLLQLKDVITTVHCCVQQERQPQGVRVTPKHVIRKWKDAFKWCNFARPAYYIRQQEIKKSTRRIQF
eukprot:SM000053S17411  [mRNA]  locus=s53:270701:276464:+ [translate_table: standard]